MVILSADWDDGYSVLKTNIGLVQDVEGAGIIIMWLCSLGSSSPDSASSEVIPDKCLLSAGWGIEGRSLFFNLCGQKPAFHKPHRHDELELEFHL